MNLSILAMNRKLFGCMVLIVIISSVFLCSCDISQKYHILYKKYRNGKCIKCSAIVDAKDIINAKQVVQEVNWIASDSIDITSVRQIQ